MIYAVYGRWDHGAPIPPSAVETIGRNFRPDDDEVCVWVERDQPSMLLISIDAEVASYEEALQLGRDALVEAVGIAFMTGSPVEVAAMTEEGQVIWSP